MKKKKAPTKLIRPTKLSVCMLKKTARQSSPTNMVWPILTLNDKGSLFAYCRVLNSSYWNWSLIDTSSALIAVRQGAGSYSLAASCWIEGAIL